MMDFFQIVLCLFFILSVISYNAVKGFVGTYGVNYGRIANNLPAPTTVVTLLKSANIQNVRVYDADQQVLKAHRGSGIHVTVGIGNEYLKEMSIGEDRARNWLKKNVEPFLPGTRIAGIAVGNEVLGNEDRELWEALLPAMKNMYAALAKLGFAELIEVSTPHSQFVLASSYPPSACVFKEDVVVYLKPLLQFFSQIGSPFYVNAYPFLAYKNDPLHVDLNYALFEPNAGITDPTTRLRYDNMLDAQIDATYAALEKAGFRNMKVIVSETGWASGGDENESGATVQNARIYNGNLRRRLWKKKATPYRPEIAVRAFVFALFNENLKPGPSSERNFGLFKHDGSACYDIGFTGVAESSGSSSRWWMLASSSLLASANSIVALLLLAV